LFAGSRDSQLHAFFDEGSFQFGHGCKNVKDHSPHGRRRIHVLTERNEIDTEPVEFIEGKDEVLNGSGEPIKSSDQDRIKLPPPGVFHQSIEFGPLLFRATPAAVRVLGNDRRFPNTSPLSQGKELRIHILAMLPGGDSRIDRNAHLHL
jgi:hypothetical protein